MTPGVAGYPGQFGNVLIKKETFDKFINSMVGVPVIIRHKDFKNLVPKEINEMRVGVVSNVWFDEKDGWYWCDGIIWDETAQNLITDKGWSVSCSYNVKLADDAGGTENSIPYDIEFLDGVFTHLALVDNPRYERANIVFNSKTIANFNPNHDEKGRFCEGSGSKSFKAQIKDVIDGRVSDKTLLNVLDKPSQPWTSSGLPDKPLVMSVGVYKKATETKHQVDKETIEKLPELIQNPLYIFKSSTQQGSFVGVLDAVENKEKSDGPLIVAIKPGNENLEVNIITSTYGKDKDFINRELNKGNLLYENKKTGVSNRKASIALKVNNLSNSIITYNSEDFNPPGENMKNNEVDNENWKTLYDKNGEPYHVDFDSTDDKNGSKEKKYKYKNQEHTAKELLKKGFTPVRFAADLTNPDNKNLTYLTKGDFEKIPISEEEYVSLEKEYYKNLNDRFKNVDYGKMPDKDAYNIMKHKKERISNAKEQDMALLDELKKLITKVENDKGENMTQKEQIMRILNSADVDDEVKRQVENALDKEDDKPADKSEDPKKPVDDEKEDDEKKDEKADNKKVKNEETKEDEKKYDDLKKDVKEVVENKCKNSVDNSKGGYFDKMNEIYNSAMQPKQENLYVSRADKLKAAEEYFAK